MPDWRKLIARRHQESRAPRLCAHGVSWNKRAEGTRKLLGLYGDEILVQVSDSPLHGDVIRRLWRPEQRPPKWTVRTNRNLSIPCRSVEFWHRGPQGISRPPLVL